jgi:glycosyltransferase involved in cell wall biosynthesis
MKILLVHNRYQQRGGEDIVFEQDKKNLERSGNTVVTYERTNHEIENWSIFKRASLIKQIVWSGDTVRDFSSLLCRETPDVVHVHNTFIMVSPSIYSACRKYRVPVVQTLQNYRLMCPGGLFFRNGQICEDCVENGLWTGIRHGCYRNSQTQTAGVALMLAVHRHLKTYEDLMNCGIAATEFARGKFIEAGFDPNRIVVKPNFVDPDPGPRTCSDDYVVYAGRLSHEKGLTTLFGAWKLLDNKCALKVVGDGPLRESLEAKVNELGLRNVSFCGHLSREKTIAVVKRARFQIVPSVCYENFPMAIVEAFGCGVPIVCSKLGGMKEIVTDKVTGLHFTPSDEQDLAQKVEWAWNHPAEVENIGHAARRKYEIEYTAEKNYSRLMQIYEQTAASYA